MKAVLVLLAALIALSSLGAGCSSPLIACIHDGKCPSPMRCDKNLDVCIHPKDHGEKCAYNTHCKSGSCVETPRSSPHKECD